MKTLTELFLEKNYDTDKYYLGYIDNLYASLFNSFCNKKTTILEIGVHRGGSIFLWNDYLSRDSVIYTLDVHFCSLLHSLANVTQIVKDAYSYEAVNMFLENSLDIIIDDGPHTFNSFIFLIENYYSKLKPNGVMVIEDIINIKWTRELIVLAQKIGYSSFEVHDMRKKQKTPELLQMWAEGLDVLVLKK